MASTFKSLHHFAQVSTAYSNTFIPDGIIEEKIYPREAAESELKQIITTGSTPYAAKFPWPYGYAKHLTERLLFHRYPQLPILIARPSCIRSAVSSPYPLYGPRSPTPIEQLFRLLTLNLGTSII